jgi:hypothetical protein
MDFGALFAAMIVSLPIAIIGLVFVLILPRFFSSVPDGCLKNFLLALCADVALVVVIYSGFHKYLHFAGLSAPDYSIIPGYMWMIALAAYLIMLIGSSKSLAGAANVPGRWVGSVVLFIVFFLIALFCMIIIG